MATRHQKPQISLKRHPKRNRANKNAIRQCDNSGLLQLSGGTLPHLLGRGQGCSYIGGVSCHKGLAHSKQQSGEG